MNLTERISQLEQELAKLKLEVNPEVTDTCYKYGYYYVTTHYGTDSPYVLRRNDEANYLWVAIVPDNKYASEFVPKENFVDAMNQPGKGTVKKITKEQFIELLKDLD